MSQTNLTYLNKFKDGYRVLVITDMGTFRTGQVGVVLEDDGDTFYPLDVVFVNEDKNGNTNDWFNHSDLEYSKNQTVLDIINDL